MKALIAEYDFISRKLLEKILSQYGKCDCVDSGKKAYEKFKNSLSNNSCYDLLIVDAMLPIIDSLDLLNNIRSLENEKYGIYGTGAECHRPSKIMLTTLSGEKNELIDELENRFDILIEKPIEKEKVISEIKRIGLI